MKKCTKCLFLLIIYITSVFSAFAFSSYAKNSDNDFDYITYPDSALTEFDDSVLDRISSGDDYVSNRGYDETSLYLSPFWTMKINGSSVPMYSTPVYDYVLDRGVIQSFQYIFIEKETKINIELNFSAGKISNAVVLSREYEKLAIVKNNSVFSAITSPGAYTFLINGDSQEYAVTVFVKTQENEEAQINELIEKYGEDNVEIFEKGYYSADSLPAGKDAIYFKRGSFVSFNHITDIRSDADAESVSYPSVFEMNGKKNAVIRGCGTFDFTKIDRRERNLVNMNFCEDSSIEGLILLNPNSWTLTAYASENCTVKDITVFGYRTNSDGINICGCGNMTVSDCFCRNGDDCFSVKATNEYYECHDIIFKNCIGWSNKARCFGVTGEIERNIYNITFRDSAVIFRNATWDLDRTASLAVAIETGHGDLNNIVFENIKIHRDTGRPIYCMVYGDDITDCSAENIIFRNIDIRADEKIKISSERSISFWGKISAKINGFIRKHELDKFRIIKNISDILSKNYASGNHISAEFDYVYFNGKKINSISSKYFVSEGNVDIITD